MRLAGKARARTSLVGMAAAASLVVSGCGFTGIYDIPMPGGADIGDRPMEIKVQLADVLDLVPQTHVKINEVAVGRIQKIELADDWHAEVTTLVHGDVDLPANSHANIKMSSLLGEKYLELTPPPEGSAEGKLADGAVIPLARTNRNTEIEEVLGALSMLLNGGGVEQLNTITKELAAVSEGKEAEIKQSMRNTEEFVRGLDGQTGQIERALDGLNRLSKILDEEKDVIEGALDELAPGMEVLIDQREELVEMLTALRRLSSVAVDTMNQSKDDLVDNLESLRPILKNVADAGQDLPNSLELLVSFPFADSAVDMVKGDYANLYADFEIDLDKILEYFDNERGHPMPDAPIIGDLPLERESSEQSSPLELPRLPLSSGPSGSLSDPAAEALGGLLGGGR
jgi:phospholipid/cholesterol/gamma-HCH transport system substrate-binding protein